MKRSGRTDPLALDVPRARLASQRIADGRLERPSDVVRRFGAVQAQDYLASLWAIGLRVRAATERDVEAAAADGSIVRTWPMRGTLHFVAAEDVRWMLGLLTPRVIAGSAGRHRQLELDAAVFARAERLVVRALEGGGRITRPKLFGILREGGVDTGASRGLHILGYLAQRQVLCFAGREGKQQTLALLDEWVKPTRALTREESLAELARRYFTSHGPATAHDFAWWSGLKLTEVRTAIDLAAGVLEHEVVDGRTLWFSGEARAAAGAPTGAAHLLPYFDEYTVAYRDRSDVLDADHASQVGRGGILNPTLVIDGQMVGTWRRELEKSEVRVTLAPFCPLKRKESAAARDAAGRYAAFLERTLVLG